MLWEHILQRKNVSILIDKDPFRLALRVLKIFELIQKSRRGQPKKCASHFEILLLKLRNARRLFL